MLQHRLLRRIAGIVLFPIALVLVLAESTVWRPLTALGGLLARLPLFAALERLVARLSPGMVIAAFLAPFAVAIPLLNLGEVWLFVHGHVAFGMLLVVLAKVVGVAFSARLFAIARPKMMQVGWFAWSYEHVVHLLRLGHDLLDSLPAWVAARRAIAAAKARLGGWARQIRLWLHQPGRPGMLGRRMADIRRLLPGLR